MMLYGSPLYFFGFSGLKTPFLDFDISISQDLLMGRATASRSTSPATVMPRNAVESPTVVDVIPDLYYFFTISFYKYDRRLLYGFQNDFIPPTGRNGNLSSDPNKTAEGLRQKEVLSHPITVIKFPLPLELADNYRVGYEQVGIGLLGKFVSDVWRDGSFSATTDGAELGKKVGAVVAGAVSEGVSQNIGGTIDIIRGYMKNPVNITKFAGLPLREHRFTWKIIPESEEENKNLIKAIKLMRRHTLPFFKTRGNINFIQFPDFCTIKMQPYTLPFPKPMVINDLTFDYSSNQGASFYKNGLPTSYTISMSLAETTIATREDFERDPNDANTIL